MHSIENEHAPQEETPVEDTVTVSLREYQMMKEALEDMKRKNTAEIKGKTVIERTITPHRVKRILACIIVASFLLRLRKELFLTVSPPFFLRPVFTPMNLSATCVE